MNLLEETTGAINAQGFSVGFVAWCGSPDYGYFTWDEFAAVADVEYDDGFGAPHVALDLIIAMQDGSYFEREEYDGAENWRYVPVLKKPAEHRLPPKSIARGAWSNLAREDGDA